MIGLPDLHEDVILLILDYLEIWEFVRLQFVSKTWRNAFSNETFLRAALKRYPGAYDLRAAGGIHAAAAPSAVPLRPVQWRALAQSVASRYYYLSRGKARKVSRLSLFAAEQVGQYFPVGQWEHHESQPSGRLYYQNAAPHLGGMQTKPYLFRQTLWTYSDGLLVCAPVPADDINNNDNDGRSDFILSLFDLSTSQQVRVPFSISGKIIRNIRLADRVLIIEWAERSPFHSLNDVEQVHRHFVTCFDVKLSNRRQDGCDGPSWNVEFRSEFKIHFLGLPLNSKDRFFSTHNTKHYVVYFFQPNRSMYTGEEMPIESLFVWDISQPSTYLPSTDPSAKHRPSPGSSSNIGPTIIARFPFNRLDDLGVRQHSQIKLMSLAVDSTNCQVIWRENICEAAYGYFDPAERARDWRAKTIIFPFVSHGPHQCKARDGYLPPYRGHASMESCDIEEEEIEGNKSFVPVMDVLHHASGVRFSLVETCFTGLVAEQTKLVRIKVPSYRGGDEPEYVNMQDDALVRDITAMGRIAGDERFLIGMSDKMELIICQF